MGHLTLVGGARGLRAVLWEDDRAGRVLLPPLVIEPDDALLLGAERQLTEYFAGTRRSFDLPLDFRGSEFQRSVWVALLDIPFGETRSYAAIARSLGKPDAMRAVGAANGRNPISIIAPCHRVVGSNGALTGFAGGLAAKEFLLRHEGPPRLI